MVTSFTIRNATAEDAPDMVRLINIASHGLPLWCWSRLNGGGKDPWQAGRDSVCNDRSAVSWRNGTIATLGSDVVALMIAYQLPQSEPDFADVDDNPVFAPLNALKSKAEGTFYINVLAAYAEYRGRGLGSVFIDKAERLADGRDLSLIVSDANGPARRFYQRNGFEEVIREKIAMADGWQSDGENWLLMRKRA